MADQKEQKNGEVILVDDDNDFARLAVELVIQNTLGKEYQITYFDKPAKAVKHVRDKNAENISLVITDLNMKGMDGQLLGRLVQTLFNGQVPVIFFSSGEPTGLSPKDIFVSKSDLVGGLPVAILQALEKSRQQ